MMIQVQGVAKKARKVHKKKYNEDSVKNYSSLKDSFEEAMITAQKTIECLNDQNLIPHIQNRESSFSKMKKFIKEIKQGLYSLNQLKSDSKKKSTSSIPSVIMPVEQMSLVQPRFSDNARLSEQILIDLDEDISS